VTCCCVCVCVSLCDCRRKATRPPTSSQGPPRLGNSNSSSQRRKSTGGSSQQCSDSSSWGASSDDAAGADSSDGGEECESDTFACHTPATAKKPRTGLQPGSQSQGAAAKGRRATTAAAAVAASKLTTGPLLLLQPSFRHATAWQYSSSNLLRVSQGWGKRRFKPVVNPDALLRPPAVNLKQLGHSMHIQQGRRQQVQVSRGTDWLAGCTE
jgi:hypothetical protein